MRQTPPMTLAEYRLVMFRLPFVVIGAQKSPQGARAANQILHPTSPKLRICGDQATDGPFIACASPRSSAKYRVNSAPICA